MSGKGRWLAAFAALAALSIALPMTAGAASGPSVDRIATGGDIESTSKRGAGSFERASRVALPANRACDLRCTQRVLLKVIKKHNKLAKQFNRLANGYYNCERTMNVTQYNGYDYYGAPGATSALDFTETGGTPSARMLVWVC